MAADVPIGRLRASPIEKPGITRRVVCATIITRPLAAASAAIITLVNDVLRPMVDGGEWSAR